MKLSIQPLGTLRQSFEQIGNAINASAAFTRAASERQAALSRRQAQAAPAPLF
ncbi:hypothetical protein FE840_010300 [Peteryoungia desertarenae]|uniref:Uncharacterized protein n=1 Tax=Peteryoungia desertarenae TaxID=1813451 RepID=A0ABX6QP06_9HYPH|nr:hypothetical protein [Peteryoungia desertarenae]QLF69895.1 hypothetical protein FE840_010300 [Peteryoungia desertarenae]